MKRAALIIFPFGALIMTVWAHTGRDAILAFSLPLMIFANIYAFQGKK
jgi:hypothetical protein